jgi:hypothetical protein
LHNQKIDKIQFLSSTENLVEYFREKNQESNLSRVDILLFNDSDDLLKKEVTKIIEIDRLIGKLPLLTLIFI